MSSHHQRIPMGCGRAFRTASTGRHGHPPGASIRIETHRRTPRCCTTADLFVFHGSCPEGAWLTPRPIFKVQVGQPFSDAHFSGHCFRLIPASGSFAASAFTVPRQTAWVPPIKQPLACDSTPPRSLSCPKENGVERKVKRNVLSIC